MLGYIANDGHTETVDQTRGLCLALLVLRVFSAVQVIHRRIHPTSWVRRWDIRPTGEEILEYVDAVSQIHGSVVVRISGVHAGRIQSVREQMGQDGDRITDVQGLVYIDVAAPEL